MRKKFKKIISLLLAATLLLSMSLVSVHAQSGETKVIPTESNYDYAAVENGISLTGLKSTYLAGLTNEQKQNIFLDIPGSIDGKTVVSIGSNAFNLPYNSNYSGCSFVGLDLSKTTGLKRILSGAFYGNPNIRGQLSIPDSVIEIGQEAFRDCSGISGELRIPENVETLGKMVFSGATGITSLKFMGNKLTELPVSAFRKCSLSNGSVTIPSSIQKLGATVFAETGLKTIYLPKKADPANTSFLVSNTFGSSASSSKLTAIVCHKDDFDEVCKILGTSYAKRVGYEMKVSFVTNDGSAYEAIDGLFNLPYNYKKDAQGIWNADSSYRFPQVDGKGWGTAADAVKPVAETEIIKQENLYMISLLENPVITYSGGIDKVYDGNSETLSVTATHPKARPFKGAGNGDVCFRYRWKWDTISPTKYELDGFDLNAYEVTDVRSPQYAISCTVEVYAYIIENGKAKIFYSTRHSFPVDLRQADPVIHPQYPTGEIKLADGMPEISLAQGDSPGTINWEPGQTLQTGIHDYTWKYTPAMNSVDSCNYKEKTGSIKLNGVEHKHFRVTLEKTSHGQINPADSFDAVEGSDAAIQFSPDSGYHLSRVTVNGTDVTSAVVNQTYTLKNVQSDCKISAVFSPDSQNGMENIISKLPEVPAGNPPTDDQKTSILEAKLQYEAMPAKEKKAVSETAKKELCDAIAQLPQVKTAVEGTLTVADQNLLLENMTSEDVEKLSQDSSVKLSIIITSENASPKPEEQTAIDHILNGAEKYKSYDIHVIKKMAVNGSNEIAEPLTQLESPVTLVFPVPQELQTAPDGYQRTVFIARTHDEGSRLNTEVLADLDHAADTLTVASDKFSIYTLAWQDTKIDSESAGPTEHTDTLSPGKESSSPSKQTVDTKEAQPTPPTGDESQPLTLWVAAAVLAGAVLVLLMVSRRKRQ